MSHLTEEDSRCAGSRWRWFIAKWYWRLLTRSCIFRYWWRQRLIGMLYDLEAWDLKGDDLKEELLEEYQEMCK